jgi:hypothetical protein
MNLIKTFRVAMATSGLRFGCSIFPDDYLHRSKANEKCLRKSWRCANPTLSMKFHHHFLLQIAGLAGDRRTGRSGTQPKSAAPLKI